MKMKKEEFLQEFVPSDCREEARKKIKNYVFISDETFIVDLINNLILIVIGLLLLFGIIGVC